MTKRTDGNDEPSLYLEQFVSIVCVCAFNFRPATPLLRVFRVRIVRRRLATYLPHLVDETKGIAKWDLKQETLAVTLPIIDEKW